MLSYTEIYSVSTIRADAVNGPYVADLYTQANQSDVSSYLSLVYQRLMLIYHIGPDDGDRGNL
jgi:hypothetical protein